MRCIATHFTTSNYTAQIYHYKFKKIKSALIKQCSKNDTLGVSRYVLLTGCAHQSYLFLVALFKDQVLGLPSTLF